MQLVDGPAVCEPNEGDLLQRVNVSDTDGKSRNTRVNITMSLLFKTLRGNINICLQKLATIAYQC